MACWNEDFDNPNNGEHVPEADNESDIMSDSGIDDTETPEDWDVRSTVNVTGLIQPTLRSKIPADMVLMMVNTTETRRNKGNSNK